MTASPPRTDPQLSPWFGKMVTGGAQQFRAGILLVGVLASLWFVPRARADWSFAILGDTRGAHDTTTGISSNLNTIATKIAEMKPDLVLVGGFGTMDGQRFGSSQYAKQVLGQLWGLPPALDMAYEKRVHEAMREIAMLHLAESAHDLSDGGLAVALAESSTPEVGAKVTMAGGLRPEFALFGEAPSRILVSTKQAEQILVILSRHEVQGGVIGVTIGERLQIEDEGKNMLINVSTASLRDSSEAALPALLHTQHAV